MAVDHPNGEAGPSGVVAGSDGIDEGFLCGKTGCCMVPSQGLVHAGKIKSGIEGVCILLWFQWEFPKSRGVAPGCCEDRGFIGLDISCRSVINSGPIFVEHSDIVDIGKFWDTDEGGV